MAQYRWLVTVATLLFVTINGKAEDATLRWRFTEGISAKYVANRQVTQTTKTDSGEMVQKTALILDFKMTPKKIDSTKKSADVAVVISRLQVKLEGRRTFDYDSDKKEDSNDVIVKAVEPLYKTIIGSEIVYTVDELGNVAKVSLPEKLKAAIDAVPTQLTAMPMCSEAYFKSLATSEVVLPEAKIAVGKSWMKEFVQEQQVGTYATKNRYTYRGPSPEHGKSIEKIEMTTIGEITNSKLGAKITSQENSSVVLFDNAVGRIHDIASKRKVTMNANDGTGKIALVDVDITSSLKLATDK